MRNHTRVFVVRLCAFFLISATPLTPCLGGPVYSITDLGTNVSGLHLNDAGQVVGMRGTNAPFLYSGGTFTTLDPNVDPVAITPHGKVINGFAAYPVSISGSSNGAIYPMAAAGANNLGQVVGFGFSYPVPGDPARVTMPYVFSPAGATLPSNETSWTAHGVWYPTPGGDFTGSMSLLNVPWSSMLGARANGINDAGAIVGSVPTTPGPMSPTPDNPAYHSVPLDGYGSQAFLIDAHGFHLLGSGTTSANAINSQGQIVGLAGDHAFLDSGGKITDLGALSLPHYTNSNALAISDNGVVVGTSTAPYYIDPARAFAFDQGIMYDLNDRLSSGPAGWILNSAVGVNNTGQIVGVGTLDGVEHGFLLNPDHVLPAPVPEPASIWLFLTALGALGLAQLHRGRRRSSALAAL